VTVGLSCGEEGRCLVWRGRAMFGVERKGDVCRDVGLRV